MTAFRHKVEDEHRAVPEETTRAVVCLLTLSRPRRRVEGSLGWIGLQKRAYSHLQSEEKKRRNEPSGIASYLRDVAGEGGDGADMACFRVRT